MAVFSAFVPSNLVDIDQLFSEAYWLLHEDIHISLMREGQYVLDYKVQHPGRQSFWWAYSSGSWEPEILTSTAWFVVLDQILVRKYTRTVLSVQVFVFMYICMCEQRGEKCIR